MCRTAVDAPASPAVCVQRSRPDLAPALHGSDGPSRAEALRRRASAEPASELESAAASKGSAPQSLMRPVASAYSVDNEQSEADSDAEPEDSEMQSSGAAGRSMAAVATAAVAEPNALRKMSGVQRRKVSF